MATRHLHLTRRGALYYWRGRLPKTLRAIMEQTHLTWSLHTANPKTARRLARAVSAAIDLYEAKLMNAPVSFRPTKLQLRLVLERIFDRILNEGTKARDAEPNGVARFSDHGDDRPSIILSSEDSDEWTQADHQAIADAHCENSLHPENIAEKWEAAAVGNVSDEVRPLLDDALKSLDIALPHHDPEYEVVARDATRVVATAYAIEKERWEGIYNQHQGLPSFVAQKYPLDSALLRTWTTQLDQEEAAFLSQSIDDLAKAFSKHRQEQGVSPKTQSDDDMARRYFVDLIGNIRIQDLTPSHAEKFASVLLRVPRRSGKGIYKDKTPSDAIKLADRISDALAAAPSGNQDIRVDGIALSCSVATAQCERLRRKTANKHLTFFTSLWRSPLVPRSLRPMNPFEGTLYKKNQVDKESSRRGTRVPFTQGQLKSLLATSVWNGCKRPFQEEDAKQTRLVAWKYWCPLIALLTGMRREEVARLRTSDFDYSNGVWLVRIQATYDRRVKSKAGIRDIPIHSKLIDLGLHDFVTSRGYNRPLFEDLRPTGAYKEYGEQLGKWFRTYRQARDLYASQTDFHSFRHTFVHALRDGGVPIDLIALLVGHEYGGVTANVYGRQVSIIQKKQAIERLTLAEIF